MKGKTINFDSVDINVNTIAFKDKARETARQKRLAELVEAPRPVRAVQKEAWSDKKDLKVRRVERRDKKLKKTEAILKAKADGTFVPKKKKSQELEDEWAELAAEERKYKKRKKMGKEEFSSSDDDMSDLSE